MFPGEIVLIKKVLGWLAVIVVLVAGYVLQDWYRFAKYSEIDPKRGIYGNDHLEVWIDINARMPKPMREWACAALLEREAKVIGGIGRPPYGCDPGFDPNAEGPAMSKALIDSMILNAASMAEAQGATPEQAAAVTACMATDFTAKITPGQIEALDASSPDPEAMTALTDAGLAATPGCLAKAGVE